MAKLPAAEAIPANKRMRRKLEWEDTRRPAWVMWLSMLCLVLLFVSIFALANSVRMSRPTAINGDMLGPQNGESIDAYATRAAATIADVSDDQPRWALLSPEEPADVAALSAIFTDHPELRVSTLLAGGLQWQVPEPAVGLRREDVFAAVRDRMSATAFFPDGSGELRITGVIVRGTPVQLAALAATPHVKAVEALPPDAVYGRFGMRPIDAIPGAPLGSAAPDAPAVPADPLAVTEP